MSPGCAVSIPLNFQQLFLEWVQTSNNYMRRTTNSRHRQCLCGLRPLRGYTREDRQCRVWKVKALWAGEIRTNQVSFIGTLSIDSKDSKRKRLCSKQTFSNSKCGICFCSFRDSLHGMVIATSHWIQISGLSSAPVFSVSWPLIN